MNKQAIEQARNQILLLAHMVGFTKAYLDKHNKKCTEDAWIQKCVLGLNYANAFEITKLKDL